MPTSNDMVTSQIFYYLEKEDNKGVYAFDSKDGLTIPIFSSLDIATTFLEKARIRGYGVSVISPTKMIGFHEACHNLGGKFLQLDPKPEVLRAVKVKPIISVLSE